MAPSVNAPELVTPKSIIRRQSKAAGAGDVTTTPSRPRTRKSKKAEIEGQEEMEESIVVSATPSKGRGYQDIANEGDADAGGVGLNIKSAAVPNTVVKKKSQEGKLGGGNMEKEVGGVVDGGSHLRGGEKKEQERREKKARKEQKEKERLDKRQKQESARKLKAQQRLQAPISNQEQTVKMKKKKKAQRRSGEATEVIREESSLLKPSKTNKGAASVEIPAYRISYPGGGRFLPIEPVFSKNELFMFLALPHTLRVYSTKTSLLHRTFKIPECALDLPPTSFKRIASYTLDPLDENNIFIATYSGKIFLWNWVDGQLVEKWDTEHIISLIKTCENEEPEDIITKSKGGIEKIVDRKGVVYIVGRPSDGLLAKRAGKRKGPKEQSKAAETTEKNLQTGDEDKQPARKDGSDKGQQNDPTHIDQSTKKEKKYPWEFFRVTLDFSSAGGDNHSPPVARVQPIHKVPTPVTAFEVRSKGNLVVAISANTLWIGNKSIPMEAANPTHKKSWGTWRFFTLEYELSCMDVNILGPSKKTNKKGTLTLQEQLQGYVVVGDTKGIIYLWNNILDPDSQGGKPGDIRRLHWHRNCVSSVKLSNDSNYIISGGNETVLVLWQIDTGHRQFLPHLTSAIENIVVSPSGTSYAIRLADNSVMVLSTTELKPKANISGIQAAAVPVYINGQPDTSAITSMDLLKLESELSTVNHTQQFFPPRVPSALLPTQANQLLLATSSHSTSSVLLTPEAFAAETCPYLQTYDTFSDRPIAKQALARTNATNAKIGPGGNPLAEPNVRLLAVSKNGEWLASLDEWSAPVTDVYDHSLQNPESSLSGREVFLKFWRREGSSWHLVTRVDSPHPSPTHATFNGGAKVLDIIPLPGITFATLGSDGCVRIWRPRVRTRGGVVVKHRDLKRGGIKDGEDIVQVNWGCRKAIQFLKGSDAASHGALTISQDGSVIAVSITNDPIAPTSTNNSSSSIIPPLTTSPAIYLISPAHSTTLHVLRGFQSGPIAALTVLSRHLIILGTDKLINFDLVIGRVKWELPIPLLLNVYPFSKFFTIPTSRLSTSFLHALPCDAFFLASGDDEKSFAVGINIPNEEYLLHQQSRQHYDPGEEMESLLYPGMRKKKRNLYSKFDSLLCIFEPLSSTPIPKFKTIKRGTAITSLIAIPTPATPSGEGEVPVGESTGGGEAAGAGYLYLDIFSTINYLTPTTSTLPFPLPPSTSAIPIESQVGLSSLYQTPLITTTTTTTTNTLPDEDMPDDDDESDPRRPISSELLSSIIFSSTTTALDGYEEAGVMAQQHQQYNLLNLAEVFDRVVGLYARPPLGEEEEREAEAGAGERMDVD